MGAAVAVATGGMGVVALITASVAATTLPVGGMAGTGTGKSFGGATLRSSAAEKESPLPIAKIKSKGFSGRQKMETRRSLAYTAAGRDHPQSNPACLPALMGKSRDEGIAAVPGGDKFQQPLGIF